jgi:hypothetical protein
MKCNLRRSKDRKRKVRDECRHALAFWSAVAGVSIPGRLSAIFLNRLLTLCPALADVSMNRIPSSPAFAVASSSVTCLRDGGG